MNPSDAIEAIEKPLSSLPYSLSRHILEHLRKLTSHEPVPGIMGKSGAGKSSLCNGEPAEFGKNRTLRFSGHP